MSIISDVGESVTLRNITRTVDAKGDATLTVGSTTATAWIVPGMAFEESIAAGILDGEDAIGFFKSSDSANVKNGNEIYCTLGSFIVEKVQKEILGTTTLHIEAVLKYIAEL